MSGWQVISFDVISERRDFAPEHVDESNWDDNPNWKFYLDQFPLGWEDEEFEMPYDRIQRRLVDEYGARTDRMGGVVYAEFPRDANCESVIEELAVLWDRAAIIHANDTSDVGHAKVYSRLPSNPEDKASLEFNRVDEYRETQRRDGTRVGDKAAAYVSFNYGFTARSRRPFGRGWDNTMALPHEVRYRVVVEDPTEVEEEQPSSFPLSGPKRVDNELFRSDTYYVNEDVAAEKAERIADAFNVDAAIEPVPVEIGWHGGVEQEFDPKMYPSYECLNADDDADEFTNEKHEDPLTEQ